MATLIAQVPQAPPRFGSIEGYVVRAGTNEPVYRAQLTLIRTDTPAAFNGQILPKTAMSDRSGHFIFTDIEPGRYNLNAQRNGFVRLVYGQRSSTSPATALVVAAGQALKDVVFRMTPTGLVTGRITDSEGEPLSGAEVGLFKFVYDGNGQRTLQVLHTAYTDDLGEFRLYWVTPGKYYLRVNYSGMGSFPGMRNPNGVLFQSNDVIAPTFYPGTTDQGTAAMIEVLPGAQLSAIDLTLTKAKAFSVRGRVITPNPTGRVRPNIMIRSRQPTGGMTITSPGNTAYNPDGTFEIRNVLPGSYYLMANTNDGPRAQVSLEVGDADVEGVVLALTTGFPLSGRIYIEGQSSQNIGAENPLENARPMLTSMDGFGGAGPLNVSKTDGTFTINQVMPGHYRLNFFGLPQDYFLKAARIGNTDILQEGVSLDRPVEGSLDLLISANAGRIEGTVVDNDGKPVRSTQVVLIPDQRDRNERYKLIGTDQNGHFLIRGIVPGDYKLFAWEELEPGAHRDPDFMQQFERFGKSIRMTEGARENVDLKLIPTAAQ